jgi:hypothetical protein
MPIVLESGTLRHVVSERLESAGVATRRYFWPSLDRAYEGREPGRTVHAPALAERVLCLPMYADLPLAEVRRICETVLGATREVRGNLGAERRANPAVTVVIAVKNAERYLAECLDSVAAQTFSDYEVVVVDGRSTDATERIARAYPKVRFIQQAGAGFADAWNTGLRAARGELIAFVDSDDHWVPSKLERQVEALRADAELQAVIGRVRFFVEPGEVPPRGFRDRVLAGDHVAQMPGVLLARRGVFELIGDWGEGMVVANDIDWFVRLKDSGLRVGVVDEVLLHKRVHSRNFSYVTAEDPVYPREVLRLLHQSILRKRINGPDS